MKHTAVGVKQMDCLVDAGEIVKAVGVSERDCANLVAIELGDRTRYPITVYVPATGESCAFIQAEPLLGDSAHGRERSEVVLREMPAAVRRLDLSAMGPASSSERDPLGTRQGKPAMRADVLRGRGYGAVQFGKAGGIGGRRG
jgi:hypothetical protein